MKCAECEAGNPDGARFFHVCGTSLVATCPECESDLLPGAQFCSHCGASASGTGRPPAQPIQEPAYVEALRRLVPREFAERLRATRGHATAERRTVTILFTDIVGSSALTEALDPEDVMDFMAGAFEVLIPPIYRQEGTVARLMGDGLLAFFGAPISHEDDPERAIRAGLEIIAGARAYAAQLDRERRLRGLDVRVGINTGLVVVGEIGSDLRVEYTAAGSTIVLASRMEQHAPPGSILITDETYRRVRGVFDFAHQEPLSVKGTSEAVQTYLVLRERPRALQVSMRGVEGVETPLVGRGAELLFLQDTYSDVVQGGTARVVTVVGDAGVGKSRLLSEFSSWLAEHAETVALFSGQAKAATQGTPYSLWRDLFANRFQILESDDPGEALAKFRRGLAPLLDPSRSDIVGHLVGFDFSSSDAVQAALDSADFSQAASAALVDYLRGMLARSHVVILLEDLHWADDSSLDLLAHVVSEVPAARLLVVAAARPALYERLPSWGEGREAYSRLDLKPLSRPASRALVGEILQRVPQLPDDLRDLIVDGAEGNPFFVEELIKMLIEDGVILAGDAEWEVALDRIPELHVPSSLTAVLQARLDRLPISERALLQRASVVGRDFWDRLVEELSADAPVGEDVGSLLASLGSRELVLHHEASVFEGTQEYAFKHAVLRDVTYETLLRRARGRYHAQIAAWIKEYAGERLAEYLGLIAGHFELAGKPEEAVEFLIQAGDRARTVGAYQEATGSYERALSILRGSDNLDRAARTLMRLGLTYHNAFRFDEAAKAYEEGFDVVRQAEAKPPGGLPPATHPLRVNGFPVGGLDPARCHTAQEVRVVRQLFSGLVRMGPQMAIAPDVAHSWDVLEAGKRYVFHLRRDVTWSDGSHVTAADFEYAWRRVLDPSAGSGNASILYVIRGARAYHVRSTGGPGRLGIRALDDSTLGVELERPTGHFLQLLASAVTMPVPRDAVRALGDGWSDPEAIITNGPFRLVGAEAGGTFELARDPTYHGRVRGNVCRVLILAHPASDVVKAYEDDGLDVAYMLQVEPAQLHRARRRHAGEHFPMSTPGLLYMVMNVARPPFNDRRVRRAFALAIDRSLLADVVFRGQYARATGGLVPPGVPGHSSGIGLPFDPHRAREELTAAGFPGGRGFPAVTICAAEAPQHSAWVRYVCSSLLDVLGLNAAWERVPWDVWSANQSAELRRRSPDLALRYGLADYPDPDCFLGHPPWQDLTPWRHSEYDELVEDARQTVDFDSRMTLYRRADRILMEEALVVPQMYGRVNVLVKPWVRNAPLDVMTAGCQDVIIDPH